MADKLDLVFKKIVNRVYTTSNKNYYEENPGTPFILHGVNVWVDDIPATPPLIDTDVVKIYNTLTLIKDITVVNNKAWLAEDPISTRIGGFISPIEGQGYTVKLFDNTDTEIPTTDASGWFFDYEAGILTFDNNPALYGWDVTSFKIKVYKYIGNTAISALEDLSGRISSQTLLELTDTPSSYEGFAGRVLRVKQNEEGIEFTKDILNNYAGSGVPVVTNDSSEGYSVGSLWIDITSSPKEAYRCLDATIGMADWAITTLSADEVNTITFLSLLDTPSNFTNAALKLVRVNAAEEGLEYVSANQVGRLNFVDLDDTAQIPSGSAGYLVKVNAAGDGLDYIVPSTIGRVTLLGLDDTPNSYTDQGGRLLRVLGNESGIEFVDVGGIAVFTDLADTPSVYDGQANKVLRVANNESGIVFTEPIDTFLELSDTPAAFVSDIDWMLILNGVYGDADAADHVVKVNATSDGLVFSRVFLKELADGPGEYTGQAHKILKVKPDETGLYFAVDKSGAFSDLEDTPSSYISYGGMLVRVSPAENGLEFIEQNFLNLTDTPSSYAGQGNKLLGVNVGATGIEFLDKVLSQFSDYPSSYAGQGDKVLAVNTEETGLEFVTVTTDNIALPPQGGMAGNTAMLTMAADYAITFGAPIPFVYLTGNSSAFTFYPPEGRVKLSMGRTYLIQANLMPDRNNAYWRIYNKTAGAYIGTTGQLAKADITNYNLIQTAAQAIITPDVDTWIDVRVTAGGASPQKIKVANSYMTVIEFAEFINDINNADEASVQIKANTPQIASGSTETPINFNVEVFDYALMFSSGSSPSQVNIVMDGKYYINGYVEFETNNTGIRRLIVKKNGDTIICTTTEQALTGEPTPVAISTAAYLEAGDYVEIYGYQDSGTDLSTSVTNNTPIFSVIEFFSRAERSFLDLTDSPNNYTGHANKLVVVNGTEDGVTFIPPITKFIDLIDTPSEFNPLGTDSNKLVRVNATGDAIVFAPFDYKLTQLIDTPSSLTGHVGKVLKVNSAENGFELLPDISFENPYTDFLAFPDTPEDYPVRDVDEGELVTPLQHHILRVQYGTGSIPAYGGLDYQGYALGWGLERDRIERLLGTPDALAETGKLPVAYDNHVLVYNAGTGDWDMHPYQVYSFLQLTDTPSSYAGLGNRLLRVNSGESGLDTIDANSIGRLTFATLNDTPASFSGHARKLLRVNEAENAVEFTPQPPFNTNFLGFQAYLSSNLPLLHNTPTVVVFDTVPYDTANLYSPVTGKYIVSTEGYWAISVMTTIGGSLDSGEVKLGIRVNGSVIVYQEDDTGTNAANPALSFMTTLPLTVGTEVEVILIQTSGNSREILGSATRATFFQMNLTQSAGIENEKPYRQANVGANASSVTIDMGVSTLLDSTYKLMFEVENTGASPFDLQFFTNDNNTPTNYQTVQEIIQGATQTSANVDNSILAIIPASSKVTGEATIQVRSDGVVDVISTVLVKSSNTGVERHTFTITSEFTITSLLTMSFVDSSASLGIKAGSIFKLYRYAQGTTSGIGKFTDLFDTPSTFSGFGGYNVIVNGLENGITYRAEKDEFVKLNDVAAYPARDHWADNDPRLVLSNWIPYVGYDIITDPQPTIIVPSIKYKEEIDLFLKLLDTPNLPNYKQWNTNTNSWDYNYSGKNVRVNDEGTGLGFFDDVDRFLELTDTPSTYTSQRGKVVRVKGDESGLEFVDPVSSDLTYTGVKVLRTTDYTHGNGTTAVLQFDSKIYDTDSMFDETVEEPTQFVFQDGGKYIINVRVKWDTNANGIRTVRIKKNGLDTILEQTVEPFATIPTAVEVSLQDAFEAEDYIEIEVYQDSGSDIDILTSTDEAMVEISRMGGPLSGGYSFKSINALTSQVEFDMIDTAATDIFELHIDCENTTGTKIDLGIFVNEDFVNNQYVNVRTYVNGADVITQRIYRPTVVPVNANTKSSAIIEFRRTGQGYFDVIARTVYKSGSDEVDYQTNVVTYKQTITKIRKIHLTALDGAGVPFAGIGVGSTFKLFKKGSVSVSDAGSGNIQSLLDLNDTPITYAGQAGSMLVVNAYEDGTEFLPVPDFNVFLKLEDTPTDYGDQAGKFLVVKQTEDGIEFLKPGASPTEYTEYIAQFSAVESSAERFNRRLYFKATSSQVSAETVLFLQADFGCNDLSTYEHSVITPGNTTPMGSHPFGFADVFSSNIVLQDSDEWYWDDNDYTVDFWIYPMSYGGDVGNNYSSYVFHQTPTGQTAQEIVAWFGTDGKFRFKIDPDNRQLTSSEVIDQYLWHHIAIVFDATAETLTLFIDGVLDDQLTGVTSGNLNNAEPLHILEDGFKLFLDMFRFSKGIALWSANFDAMTETESEIDGTMFIRGQNNTDDRVALYKDLETSIVPANIAYSNSQYPLITNMQEALDLLLYITPEVTSLTNTVGTVEVGQTVDDLTLNWVINKTITTQSFDQGIGSIDPSLRTLPLTSLGLVSTTTFTLTIGDGQNNANKSTSVLFRHKRYWGTSDQTVLSDPEILALSNEFSTSRAQTRTFDCSGGKYFYICYPASWGAATFKVGGLAFTDMLLSQQNFVNASGHTESYYIYRPNNLQTGSSILVEVS